MSLLALDLGTKTGYAIASGKTQLLAHGTQKWRKDRFEGGGMIFEKFRRWLTELCHVHEVEEVVFEEVRRHRGTDASHKYGSFLGVLTAFCENAEIPYTALGVGTIKKAAFGKGSASKFEVIKAMKDRWGVVAVDDNHADALAALHAYLPEYMKGRAFR